MHNIITKSEMERYFMAITGEPSVEDQDFVQEIEAHAAECDECFERLEAFRLLYFGFAFNPAAVARIVTSNQSQSVFAKLIIASVNGIKQISDVISKNIHAVDISGSGALAFGTRAADDTSFSTANKGFSTDDGGIIVKLESNPFTGEQMLFIYSKNDIPITVRCNDKTVKCSGKLYDDIMEQYVFTYPLDDGEYDISI